MSGFDRRVDPEVREVRRLEVINGALGRRRWSAGAKVRIVAESLALPAAELSFVPVVETAADVPSAETSDATVGTIEVVLGGALVRVPPGADAKLLTRVLRAVKAVG